VRAGAWKDSWTIPKLELLQSVIPSIRDSGAVMQWSADITEHAHIQEIKVPACAGNNQNYYSQIARYLDRSEKCFRFDLTTHLHSQASEVNHGEDDEDELPLGTDDRHEPDSEDSSFADHLAAFCPVSNYFAIADALRWGCIPTAIKPFCTFSNDTTAFVWLPSLRFASILMMRLICLRSRSPPSLTRVFLSFGERSTSSYIRSRK